MGKTSLTLTLPCDMSRVLYLGPDPGELALRNVDIRALESQNGVWDQEVLQEVYNYILLNRKLYDWLVIDGLDTIGNEVNYYNQETYKDGRKAWDQTNIFMDRWIRRTRDVNGISTLWITHPVEKADDMNRVKIKPAMPGNQLKDNINNYFDIIGFMKQVRTADGSLTPLIQFSKVPDERYEVGDRSGQLLPYEAPNMAAIVEKVKKAGMSFSDYLGEPTPGEIESLKILLKLDKVGTKRKQVEDVLSKCKVKSPAELSRVQYNELMQLL